MSYLYAIYHRASFVNLFSFIVEGYLFIIYIIFPSHEEGKVMFKALMDVWQRFIKIPFYNKFQKLNSCPWWKIKKKNHIYQLCNWKHVESKIHSKYSFVSLLNRLENSVLSVQIEFSGWCIISFGAVKSCNNENISIYLYSEALCITWLFLSYAF